MTWRRVLRAGAASSLLSWLFFLLALGTAQSLRPRHPVVLIPGIAASVLDGKLNRPSTAAWYCTKRADWRVLYFSFREALSPLCLCDELTVHYDAASNTFHNQPGVEIRAHDFGGLSGVASLDPSQKKLTATYEPLIKALESVGYVAKETLWGAPYDWRFAGDGLAALGVAEQMQELIGMAVSVAGGQPAVVIAHSMGNLVLGYFIKLWGLEWTEKHIRMVIAASGPWGGAVDAIKGIVSGNTFGLPLPHNLLHSVQGVCPSGPWLFPSPAVWPQDEVIVRTNVRHYTAGDLEELLHDIGAKQLATAFPKLRSLHDGQLSPGAIPVPMVCVYGKGLPTDEAYIYNVADLNMATAPEPHTVKSNDGDGTVNLRSLRACAQVGLPNTTHVFEVPGESHLGVLSSKPFLHRLAHFLDIPGAVGAAAEGMDPREVPDAGVALPASQWAGSLRTRASSLGIDEELEGLISGDRSGEAGVVSAVVERMYAAAQSVTAERDVEA